MGGTGILVIGGISAWMLFRPGPPADLPESAPPRPGPVSEASPPETIEPEPDPAPGAGPESVREPGGDPGHTREAIAEPAPEPVAAAETATAVASVERDEVRDATRTTRTFGLQSIDGADAVPVSAWLDTGSIPLYDETTDTLEFNVRGRAAAADDKGNLFFREAGRFQVVITVKGDDGGIRIHHVVTGFQNHFDGERQARITYRGPVRNDSAETATVVRTYEADSRGYALPLRAWFDPDIIDPVEKFDWLRIDDPEALTFRQYDTNRAEMDRSGTLRYRDEGSVRLSARKPGGTPFDTVSIQIENTKTGSRSTTLSTYEPHPPDVSDHVLVVYNRRSADSETLKDYYLRERPGFDRANVLSVATTTDELVAEDNYREEIESPVVAWLLETQKPIRYIVLLLDIPTRVHGRVAAEDGSGTRYQIGDSVSHRLMSAFRERGIRDGETYFDESHQTSPPTYVGTPFSLARFEGMTALVTHLNMGDLEASLAYVDKLKAFHNTGPLLHPPDDSHARNFFMEDHDAHNRLPANFFGHRYGERMKAGFARAGEMNLIHHPKGSGHITSGENVAFFGTLGRWGGRGADYAIDGQIEWGAQSDWWLMLSVESFNGQRVPAQRQGGEAHVFYGPMDQGNFVDWFSAHAFGGENYSRTPVGAVCHVEEPTTAGVNDWGYLAMWYDGFTFAECAWASRRTRYFLAIGDPLVTRKPPPAADRDP